MHRRRYLRLLAGGTVVGLAGCSTSSTPGSGGTGGGDGGNGNNGNGGGGGTPTPTTSVQDYVNVAVGKLNTVAIAFADVQDQLNKGADVNYDATEELDRIVAADAALKRASADASTQKQHVIDGLRTVADAMAAMAKAIQMAFDVRDSLQGITSLVKQRKFDEALSKLQGPKSRIEDSKQRLDASVAAVNKLDAKTMNDTNLRFSDIKDGLVQIKGIVDSFATLVEGYDAMFRGGKDLKTGQQQSENGNYGDAAKSFASAETRFDDAHTKFADGLPDAEPIVNGRFSTAECQSKHLRNAATHFKKAANAAATGNVVTANDERKKGQDELDAVKNC